MQVFLFIFLSICTTLFIWFLLRMSGRQWLYRYANRLRTNNNTRAMLCWMVTGVLFICYLLICAQESQWPVGLDVSTPHYSEEAQKWLKLYEQKMAESPTIGDATVGVWAWTSHVLQDVHNTICWFLGYTVFFLTIFSAFYTPIAFRDEFKTAWDETKDKMFGPKGGEQDLLDMKLPAPPTSPAQTQQQSGPMSPSQDSARKPLYLSNYLTYEFIFALISELTNMFIHRRRM